MISLEYGSSTRHLLKPPSISRGSGSSDSRAKRPAPLTLQPFQFPATPRLLKLSYLVSEVREGRETPAGIVVLKGERGIGRVGRRTGRI
jgi:hypothetical protein